MTKSEAAGIDTCGVPSCLNCKHNEYPYGNCDGCEMQKDSPENEGNWYPTAQPEQAVEFTPT